MPADAIEILRIDFRQADAPAQFAALRQRLSPQGDVLSVAGRKRTIEVFGEPLPPSAVVARILADVRQRGLAAALDYTARLDKVTLSADSFRVSADELSSAHRTVDASFLATVRQVRRNILEFQQAIVHRDVILPRAAGGYLRQRYLPLDRVGLCIPGGAASYPSTVLMTAVPAQAAGVRQIAVVAPPTPFGANNPHLLATCYELGISEVYRIGGAQGVAALAYGVEGLARVDKIVGPGNLFVALAKKQVYGEVDIDSIAGPSEVVVLADGSTPAEFVAADLIAQAEHSPGAGILITWSESLWKQVHQELGKQLQVLERGELAARSLVDFGALILVASADEAARLADELAPEHLHIAVDDSDPGSTGLAQRLLEGVRHAGAAFIGPFSPVAVGDYVAGPSHVLPTGGTARFASGLSANDFLRRMSVIHFTREGLELVAEDLRRLAEQEGLTAHWASVDRRLK